MTTGLQGNLLNDGIVDTLLAVGTGMTEMVCSSLMNPVAGHARLLPMHKGRKGRSSPYEGNFVGWCPPTRKT